MLDRLLFFCLLSLGFRWFVFQYKRMGWFRSLLLATRWAIAQELLQCPYCQTVEAATVIYGVLWLAGIKVLPLPVAPFAVLFSGWTAIVIESWCQNRIDELEATHENHQDPGQ